MSIFDEFRAAADRDQAKKMSAYMRDQFDFLGLPKPVRAELSKGFLKSIDKSAVDWDFVGKCWQQKEREFQYLAIDYLLKFKKKLTLSDLTALRKLITDKSWWETVDTLNPLITKLSVAYPTEMKKKMLQWSQDKNFWIRRIAIDHQLLKKEATDKELLAEILENNFGSEEFFINKAIGWALRDYSKVNPKWVSSFIKKHQAQMDKLSVREASKYLDK